ncbi:MAG: hypothetical protein JWQ77_2538 [Jatrophihabitans sp.]|nr:hypothetical protein [Jatrophihabitans sp.]
MVGETLRGGLAGQRLTEFAFVATSGLALRLGALGTELRISSRLSLGRASAPLRLLDPTVATDQLLPLLDAEVTRTDFVDGVLAVTFAYSTVLRVPPSVVGEAWQLRTADGLLVVSRRGGGVTIWRPPTAEVREVAPRW